MAYWYPWYWARPRYKDRDRRRDPSQHDRDFRGIDYDRDTEHYVGPPHRHGFFGPPDDLYEAGPEDYYQGYDPRTDDYGSEPGHRGTVGRLREWMREGPHTGRGPKGYQRSAESIKEEACERLTRHGQVDASNIQISVANNEVTLEGTVDSRRAKRMAEDAVESISGVKDVHNRLRIQQSEG